MAGSRGHLAKGGEGAPRGSLPGQSRRTSQRGVPQFLSQRLVFGQRGQRRRQALDIVRCHEQPAAFEQLRQRALASRHDGRSARGGLDGWQSEPLAGRWERQRGG